MSHSTLAPVFTGLRLGLHALLLGLTVFAVARSFAVASPAAWWVCAVAALFALVYLAGAAAARFGERTVEQQEAERQDVEQQNIERRGIAGRGIAVAWMSALTLLWALLVWLSPEGAYLVFPLFFLYLHLLPGAGGGVTVVLATGFAIVALGVHSGFSVGGVVGPLVGAGVALLIGLAYRALNREAEERERLLTELVRTRHQLAETEREQGALAERARLAREIHDTVAQGLSSIQMLLHAAERDTPEPGAGYLRLARETAADSLAETRQIIRELTPSRLDDGLAAALRRLGQEQAQRTEARIEVAAEEIELPMEVQTALLRIAQGALSNALRHAAASRISVALREAQPGTVALAVVDDGRGFDPSRTEAASHESGSFGLRAMRERVAQLGGSLDIRSTRGSGTAIVAEFASGRRA